MRVRANRWLWVVASLPVLAMACGSDDASSESCLDAQDARICAETDGATVTIDGEGFLPGSEILLDVAGGELTVVQVGDDGRTSGATGFIGGQGAGPLVIAVSGTAASGTDVSGEIVS